MDTIALLRIYIATTRLCIIGPELHQPTPPSRATAAGFARTARPTFCAPPHLAPPTSAQPGAMATICRTHLRPQHAMLEPPAAAQRFSRRRL